MQSGNLNFLEPSGPLQACNGTALPFYLVASSWNFKLFHEEDARLNNPQVYIYELDFKCVDISKICQHKRDLGAETNLSAFMNVGDLRLPPWCK